MSTLEQAITALETAPKVNIKGKQYTQVASRVEVFRRTFGLDYAIVTEILDAPNPLVRVKASILQLVNDSGGVAHRVIATGLAEEDRTAGMINKTSALENAETSAIGRALAAFGLHGGEYASAGEVEHAIAQQGQKAPAQKAIMSGPHKTSTALKEAASALMALIVDDGETPDELALDAHLKDHKDTVNQIMTDAPTWWHGKPNSDQVGMEERIKKRRDELRQRVDPVAAYGAG